MIHFITSELHESIQKGLLIYIFIDSGVLFGKLVFYLKRVLHKLRIVYRL